MVQGSPELSYGQCSWVAVGLYSVGDLASPFVRLNTQLVPLQHGAAWEAVSTEEDF